MQRILIILIGLFVSKRVSTNDIDESLFFRNNEKGEICLSSLNSSQQIHISKSYRTGDTLFVNYKRGIFIRPKNVLPLDSTIKYLKCANKKHLIKFEDEKYIIIDM